MDKYQAPAAPPPEGLTPNFDNPDGSEYEIYSISIGMCAAATLVLVARLYTRAIILKALGIDDWLCVAGMLCAWAFAILSIINIPNGYGVHIWNLRVYQVIAFKKIDLGEEVVYGLGVWFVKTAILAFYLRLSPEKRFRQINYAIMIFVALYSIVSVVMFVVGCIPVATMWDITLMDNAKCFSQLDLVYGNAACNVLSDLITLILPIRLCWSLHLNRKQKTMLMGLFLLGSFACVVAVVRIVTMLPFTDSGDFTWYKVTIAKWCIIEINVCVLCACLPAMRPFVKIFPKFFGSLKSSSNSYNYNGRSMDSYRLRPTGKKANAGWDNLTELDTQHLTTAGQEEAGEHGSSRTWMSTPKTPAESEQPAIFKSTNIAVTYNNR